MRRRTFLAGLALVGGAPLVRAGIPYSKPLLLPEALGTYRDARRHGGPGKDGIPSIDTPRFWSVDEANAFLEAGDRVIGHYRGGVARAYPQRILVWHEIVNDKIAGTPLAITYCPLTGTALAFERGDTELGVSGKLINSNLVMYDRATGSEYPQILGTGISGPSAGKALKEHRVIWTTWERWRSRHPETRVLSTETGHIRSYRGDPYGGYNPRGGYYEEDSNRLFPVLNEDGRFPPKHEILGFRDRDHAVAVEPAVLADRGVVLHRGSNGDYAIVHDPELATGWVFRGKSAPRVTPDNIVFAADGPRIPDHGDLEPVNAFEAMWFAWAAFYPGTEVIDAAPA
ncbi:MAG: DUF3179 domain-containing protein [Halofilum sp. (in: g-proteobacteria)]